ncbi:hypothetical protein ASE14_02205 [Agromyces sp. Root81]|uniref:hypothetical protein n=1 Tax=Agromyces sp. Root81 TaxID=1736601 RepID=UPI0006F3D87C|nr:hypothetical protein [Agromyces sp. Root81]KRC62663.1 hypothetical protein ASE14_02205 [Agromyces sp. Root81]
MRDEDDSARRSDPITGQAEPPYQALLPNLDRMSHSSFAAGTVSRRRITRALLVLAVVTVAILAAVVVAPIVGL